MLPGHIDSTPIESIENHGGPRNACIQTNPHSRRTRTIPMNLSRRDFSKLSALGLAGSLVPPIHAQSSGKKTGYAVIGLGRIAGHFMPGTRNTTNSQITALVSGHRDKAERI